MKVIYSNIIDSIAMRNSSKSQTNPTKSQKRVNNRSADCGTKKISNFKIEKQSAPGRDSLEKYYENKLKNTKKPQKSEKDELIQSISNDRRIVNRQLSSRKKTKFDSKPE